MPKIQVQFDVAGATLYAIVRNTDGQPWNGSAFETYVTANLGNYDLPMAQQGTASRYYTVDFPSGIAAGIYSVIIFRQLGGSPAETDTPLAGGSIDWDGTNIVPLSSRLAPTTAGRTLDVTATGEAGIDWSNIGSPTTTVGLSGTTIATTQKVDIETIKTQTVTCAVGVTVPALLASTTNITAGTLTTVTTTTNLTNLPSIPANWITAAGIAADAITAAKIADGAIDAATFAAGAIDSIAIATDAIGAAEVSAAAVTKIQLGLSTYAGGAVASVTGNVGGNVVGSVGSVTGAVGSIAGDLSGKVLGGGSGTLAGVGVQADIEQIGASAPAALALLAEMLATVRVTLTGSPTAASVTCDGSALPTTAGFFSTPPSAFGFSTGVLRGKTGRVTSYSNNGTTATFTFAVPFPDNPAAGDTAIVLGQIR